MDEWSHFWSISFLIVWLGSFVVVSVDSAYRKISPIFWRIAGLFGGPFALLAYGLVREKQSK
ncbi:MAG TPA: hypothetical protein G4O16_08615 [Dehalococcoidia bacterium]|nr:hypothetical protein [Dehalococcoidia bacterium]